jgi:hypothetical protein
MASLDIIAVITLVKKKKKDRPKVVLSPLFKDFRPNKPNYLPTKLKLTWTIQGMSEHDYMYVT